jgi:hypothetical protein
MEPRRGLAWRGEPESLNVGKLWQRKERGDFRVPRGVGLRSPAHRMGRLPPPPGRGGGGVRPVAPTSKPKSKRTSHNAAHYDPARIVQRDEGVGVRIHQLLSVVGRTVEHPSPASGLDSGTDQCSEAGNLVIAERVAFDVPRVQSRRNLARQRRLPAACATDDHNPLQDRPSGDRARRHAHDGTAQGAGSPKPAASVQGHRTRRHLHRRQDGAGPVYDPGLVRRMARTRSSDRRASGKSLIVSQVRSQSCGG